MKIAILGAGHMGTWLTQELSKEHETAVYDTDQGKLRKIQKAFLLKDYFGLQDFKPSILINAVSLQNTIPAFEKATPYLPENCILADMTSVKGSIPKYYKKTPFRFVSTHPMFGPTFTNVEELPDENAIIIQESCMEGTGFFQKFFTRLKLNIFEYTFKKHDRMTAYSLTLPFASTLVFASCMNTSAVPGSTFKKHKEIATGLLSEDDYLLSEILFNSYSLQQLEKVTSRLEFLKHVIKGRDIEEARKFFNSLRKNLS